MNDAKRSSVQEVLGLLIGLPIVLVLLGGLYSIPIMKVTKGREPALTVLIAIALAAMVGGIGFAAKTPASHSLVLASAVLGMLVLARKVYGSLGRNIEHFGMVHQLTLLGALSLAAYARKRSSLS